MSNGKEVKHKECVTHHHACDCREHKFKQLELQLKEANEVAEFYAKKSSWSRGEEAFDVCISDSEGWPVSRGGTRARAYLKKWEGK